VNEEGVGTSEHFSANQRIEEEASLSMERERKKKERDEMARHLIGTGMLLDYLLRSEC